MLNKLWSKSKDAKVTEIKGQSKKPSVKHQEPMVRSIQTSSANHSMVSTRKHVTPDSPMSNVRSKISRESSMASIPSPHNRVKSYISGNDSIDSRIVTSDTNKNGAILERLKMEIHDLRLQYQNDINNLRRENFDLQQDVKKTKREIYDLLNEYNESMRINVDQLDVEVRMLSKSIYDIQNHYSKFVPFLLSNFLLLMKNQEHLSHRIAQMENPQSNVRKVFQSSRSDYSGTTNLCSCTYAIAISPLPDNDDYYKLVFDPIEEMHVSQFHKEIQEQIYGLPLLQKTSSNITISPSMSVLNDTKAVRRKLVLGSKAISYQLKHIEHHSINNSTSQSRTNHNSSMQSFKSLAMNINHIITMDTSQILRFKDLKKRNLKLKLRGLRRQSYPCINPPTFGSEVFKLRDDCCSCENGAHFDTGAVDSNLLICQSDTDLFRRLSLHSKCNSEEDCSCSQIPTETLIYQQLPHSLVQELLRFKMQPEDPQAADSDQNESNRFAIILSRSKLTQLLSHNFTNLPCDLLSCNHDVEAQELQQNQFNQKPIRSNVIEDSDYFTLYSSKPIKTNVHLASVETLSDNTSFIDDDYCHQVLVHDYSVTNGVYDSYDNFCCDMERFQLPRSSANNIFNSLRK